MVVGSVVAGGTSEGEGVAGGGATSGEHLRVFRTVVAESSITAKCIPHPCSLQLGHGVVVPC